MSQVQLVIIILLVLGAGFLFGVMFMLRLGYSRWPDWQTIGRVLTIESDQMVFVPEHRLDLPYQIHIGLGGSADNGHIPTHRYVVITNTEGVSLLNSLLIEGLPDNHKK